MAVSADAREDPGAVRCELTLPCDVRFRALRECVVERLAARLGCAGAEAAARAVVLATSGLVDHPAGSVYSRVTLTFTAGGGVLTIRVRYPVDTVAAETAPGPGVESILSEGGSDAPLAVMRRLASRVEFGRVDGVECCTLVAPLTAAT